MYREGGELSSVYSLPSQAKIRKKKRVWQAEVEEFLREK
jgi:hypothetical protein